MRIENLININSGNIEEKLKRAIYYTYEELDGLTREATCMIYSSYLSKNLYEEHLANEVVSTTEFNYPYKHQFNIIPKSNDEFFVADLTYSQFNDDMFDELLEKGYMLIKQKEFEEYLNIVGNAKTYKIK